MSDARDAGFQARPASTIADELIALTRRVKERAAWLQRGGIDALPRRRAQAAPAAGAPVGATQRGALALVRDELGECTRCKLAGGRQNIVFGVGSPDAPLVFVGEAPGADEDRAGEPFVGAAGQLLTKMIEAMGLGRDEVYICNIIK